jgi:hypothetical protein
MPYSDSQNTDRDGFIIDKDDHCYRTAVIVFSLLIFISAKVLDPPRMKGAPMDKNDDHDL